jgi:hypothetical protein
VFVTPKQFEAQSLPNLLPKIELSATQKIHFICIAKTNLLMLFREIFPVSSENPWHSKMHTVGRLQSSLDVKAGDVYSPLNSLPACQYYGVW